MIGTRLGQYEILEKIGEGGMGEVYRARDTVLDRDVAIKILPDDIAANTERCARFEREAKAVAALSHPNILAIHGFGSEGGRAFAVMELLRGESLEVRLRNGPLAARKAVDVAAQLADGLAAAHEQGIVHRDLKPANVFVTHDGRAKILDFGLARMASDGTSVPASDNEQSRTMALRTQPGVVMGTVGYMSPEQVRGIAVDGRSDIFSLGAVLYEMLTGERAFEGNSPADTMGAILRDEPRRLSDQSASLSDSLSRVVEHCLEKSPEERFQSARDLAFALRHSHSGSASLPAMPAVAVPGRANTVRRLTLSLAVLGWVAVAVLLFMGRRHATPEAEPVRISTLTHSGRDWAPALSPDGTLLAFVSDRDGVARIWIKQMGGGGETVLTDGPDDLPRFSPDGSRILFVRDENEQRNLYRVSVLGGQPRKLIDDVQEADWLGTSGERIAFLRTGMVDGHASTDIGLIAERTGDARHITSVADRLLYGLRPTPNGATIAFCSAGITGYVAPDVGLLSVESGDLRWIQPNDWDGPYTGLSWSPSGDVFLIAQGIDLLSSFRGEPTQMFLHDMATNTNRALFWTPTRAPFGGVVYTTPNVLADGRVVFDDEQVTQELYEFSLVDPAQPPRVLTRGLSRDRQPAYSPDGSRIIFSSNRSGNPDLWISDTTTGEMRQITDDPANDWDPAFTPDGGSILWSSDRTGNLEIWMANTDGSHARQVSHDGVDAENPAMTLDGEWIIYGSANTEHVGLWKVRPDGTQVTQVASGSFAIPELSPDGRYVLFPALGLGGYRVNVMELETGEIPLALELPRRNWHANVLIGRARWMPDGRAIAFVNQDESGRTGIFVKEFIPGEENEAPARPLAGFSDVFSSESFGIAPDGSRIVVSGLIERSTIKIAESVQLRGWR